MQPGSETERLRRHLHQMTVLHQVSTRIVSALDPDEVVAGVLDSLADLVNHRSAAVYLSELDVTIPAEGPHTVTPSSALPRLKACRGVDGDTAVGGTPELVVPFIAGGRTIGTLELKLADPLDADDVKVLELLATTAAVALQNAYLYQETQRLATTDALTGLRNYRHFHELLLLEVQRARRMQYPVGLLMMDLDHFKLVNDRHGHPVGDLALEQVAERLRKRLRSTDVIARIGGEEFAAILPGDSLDEVAVVAEKLRQAVEELPPLQGGLVAGVESTSVTLSVGGTSLTPDVADAQLLLTCADRALYEAKRNGRNQVRLFAQ